MTKVVVVRNALTPDAGPDERDVLEQTAAVCAALDELGYEHSSVVCGLDLEGVRIDLEAESPDVVFNLVESLGGHDRLLFLVPALLDVLEIPYTGSSTEALYLATGKLTTRERLTALGVPMPRLAGVWPSGEVVAVPYEVIVKSVWQHGSPGLDERCVLDAGADLEAALRALGPRLGGHCMAEEFVDGRELNLGLLERDEGWACLPPAEIRFDAFPTGKPRIVGHDAKWSSDSFEYRATPRSFEFAAEDDALVESATEIALATVRALGLSGWARVDLRVDVRGDVRVLEANANPCLSPDAGFVAALEEAGIEWPSAVETILEAAVRRAPAASTASMSGDRAASATRAVRR